MMTAHRHQPKPAIFEALHLLGNCLATLADELTEAELIELRRQYDQVRLFKSYRALVQMKESLNHKWFKTGARFYLYRRLTVYGSVIDLWMEGVNGRPPAQL